MIKRVYLNYALKKNSGNSFLIYSYTEFTSKTTKRLRNYKSLRRKFLKYYLLNKAQVYFNASSLNLWRTILKYRKYGRAEVQKFKK